jgi:hypothetical protein
MDGWIKLYRQLVNNDLWLSEPFSRGQAWVDLLLIANHTSGVIRRRGIKITVKRGQVGYSQDTLANRWGWSKNKVRRFLCTLYTEKQITLETELKNISISTLITITNYETYQGNGTVNDTEEKPKTIPEQECKEEKEENILSVKLESCFEYLWKAYPERDGKKEALKHFKASVKTLEDGYKIEAALENYLAFLESEHKRGFNRRAKGGKVWFNNWQDWIPEDDGVQDDQQAVSV